MSNQKYGKKASVKWASDDDAGDLLASILNDTETDAAQEQQRIEAEMLAREQEALRLKDAEEQNRRSQAEARISAEMDRLQQVEVRRTQKLEALKIEDLKESGLWQPPEEPVKVEQTDNVLHAVQAAQAATPEHASVGAQASAAQQAAQPVAKKSNTTAIAILGVVAALVVIGGVVAGMLMNGSYKVDDTSYAKAVYTPKDNQILLVEKGFSPLPKPEPAAPVEESGAASSSKRPAPRGRPGVSAAPAKSAPAKAAPAKAPKKKIELDLDFDPFKSGF